ncbi:MAG TPA: GNAT family N-acetyltransferase [Polyangia bacterium]|jgi:GNAT superfamily N-acetyltransferase
MKLVLADADEKRARDRLTYEAWGEALTPEQYLIREERLCAHPWARAAMQWWLWKDDDGKVLSSCETYRMSSAVEGERGETWAVASVFTEPALRGRGHARAMMDALLERARQEGAQASTLFSDVAPMQYERSGYAVRPAEDLVFPPAQGDSAHGVDALVEVVGELEPYVDDFTVWPSRQQLDWHLERGRTYGALLRRAPLSSVGARAGEGVAYWVADWKNDRLTMLWLDAADAYEAEALVQTARNVASAARLREVRLWAQPWPFPGRADLGGDRVRRVGAVPMIAPLVGAVRAEMWTQIPRAVWV